VTAESFMEVVSQNIGNQISTAITSHFNKYDASINVLAEALKEIGRQNGEIYHKSVVLEKENNLLKLEQSKSTKKE
jgi:flagellar basal body rod protein FlgC